MQASTTHRTLHLLFGLWILVLAVLLASCRGTQAPVQFHASGNPEKLSDWNLLQVANGRLSLNAGVVPYDLNTPLFSDYAHKLRTVWMPTGVAATFEPEKTIDFPVGTIISKTFYYPRSTATGDVAGAVLGNDQPAPPMPADGMPLADLRLVETRLLVRREDGWVALPYVWNAEQTDAVLARAGDEFPLDLRRDDGPSERFTYVVPNSNQCAGCHATDNKARRIEPIGPKARHLNRDYDYGQGLENQLAHLQRIGYLKNLPTPTQVARLADWRDSQQPLEQRARAYLDINCGHCHSPDGPANTSGLMLDIATRDTLRLGLCKPPVAAGQGTGDHLFDIVPGKPSESILSYRLGSTEPGAMMPELGRGTRHDAGVALIEAWIASLPGQCDLL